MEGFALHNRGHFEGIKGQLHEFNCQKWKQQTKLFQKKVQSKFAQLKLINSLSRKNKGHKATLEALEVSDMKFIARFGISRKNR